MVGLGACWFQSHSQNLQAGFVSAEGGRRGSSQQFAQRGKAEATPGTGDDDLAAFIVEQFQGSCQVVCIERRIVTIGTDTDQPSGKSFMSSPPRG